MMSRCFTAHSVSPRVGSNASSERMSVLGEGAGVAAEEVARELVEDDDEGEHRQGRGPPGLEAAARGFGVQRAETLADLGVECRVLAEPLRPRVPGRHAEPEIKD